MSVSCKAKQGRANTARKSRINLRWISLAALTLQTTSIIILYSYSRQNAQGNIKYMSSTVVVIAEIFKLAFCLGIIFKDSACSLSKCLYTLNKEIFGNWNESVKVFIPAALYALQNNLAFYALSNLDPASYQVAYQLKILTTAIFSVLMVNRQIRTRQWLSLFLLFVGVSLVQLPPITEQQHRISPIDGRDRLLGFMAVVACCISSGFSGVYFERLVKINPHQSLWIRNFQLATFCLLISTIAMFYQDGENIAASGLLQGYSVITWIIVLLQAFGGLIVAAVVKHADNVLKGFATSISIILSTLLSFYLFADFDPSINFYFGAAFVIISTIMYSL